MTGSLLSLVATAGLVTACTGFGLFVMSVCRVSGFLHGGMARCIVGFILGTGIVGWLLFFPGVLGMFYPAVFWGTIAVGCGLFAFRYVDLAGSASQLPVSGIERLIIGTIVVAAGFDLVEALSPPADADTLAYHFALPRDFIVDGKITFVARAVSGAIPLLFHMT